MGVTSVMTSETHFPQPLHLTMVPEVSPQPPADHRAEGNLKFIHESSVGFINY